jgi:Protein of unknown function (DUF642)
MKTQVIHTNDMSPRPFFKRTNSKQQHLTNTRNRIAAIGLFLATLLSALPGFAQNNLIKNGSFEMPLVQAGSYLVFNPPGNIPGWTVVGDPKKEVAIVSGSYCQSGVCFPAENGQQWLDLTGGNNPATGEGVQQTVHTIPGETYQLSFWVGNTSGGGLGGVDSTVNGSITSTNLSIDFFCENSTLSPAGLVWQRCTQYFTAKDTSTTITFTNGDKPTDYVNGLDNVVLTKMPDTGGTWKPLNSQPCPRGEVCKLGATLLLTDGRVLVHEEPNPPSSSNDDLSNWYTLTPDVYGSYINGTWKQVASSPYAPLYFASAVLPDGRVIIEGGEYVQPGKGQPLGNPVWTNQGAIYDPVKNKWSKVDPPPTWATIGDAQSVVLPDGTFMLADCCSTEQAEMSWPYSGGSSWVSAGSMKHDSNDEEGWTLLPGPPDAEVVLTVDTHVFNGNFPCPANGSEIYTSGIWLCVGMTPTQLWGSDHEMGPAVLRPDGTVFQAGANGSPGNSGTSAIFDNNTFQWKAGPTFTCAGCPDNLDIADGPAALLPNGNVLMMTSPTIPGQQAPLGAVFFELQYGTNNLLQAAAPPNAPNDASFYGHMLVLPTGQILFTDFSSEVEIYTPTDQNVDNTWRPVLKDINNYALANCFANIQPYPPPPCLTISQNGPNTLDGLQLNGLSQGAAYGDDYQSATNYPLITITENQPLDCGFINCPPPQVYYCRTHDHDNMGVATGDLLVSTKFECLGVPKGFKGHLNVVANGIGGGGIPVVVK